MITSVLDCFLDWWMIFVVTSQLAASQLHSIFVSLPFDNGTRFLTFCLLTADPNARRNMFSRLVMYCQGMSGQSSDSRHDQQISIHTKILFSSRDTVEVKLHVHFLLACLHIHRICNRLCSDSIYSWIWTNSMRVLGMYMCAILTFQSSSLSVS